MADTRSAEEIRTEMEQAAARGDFRTAQRLKRDLDRAERVQREAPSPQPAAPGASTRSTEQAKAARKTEAAAKAAGSHARTLTTVAGVSIAVAVAALGFAGWRTYEAESLAARVEGSLVEAVVPTRDIAPGEVISASDLEMASVPAAYSPSDAAKQADEVAGLRSLTSQKAGAPVSKSSLQGSDEPASLPAAVGEGKLALMLALDTSAAASPLLSVGDRVDVLGVVSDGVVSTSGVVASDIRVIALDGNLSGDGSKGYSNVTLELTPEQAAAVSTADGVRLAVRPVSGAPATAEQPPAQPAPEQPAEEPAEIEQDAAEEPAEIEQDAGEGAQGEDPVPGKGDAEGQEAGDAE